MILYKNFTVTAATDSTKFLIQYRHLTIKNNSVGDTLEVYISESLAFKVAPLYELNLLDVYKNTFGDARQLKPKEIRLQWNNNLIGNNLEIYNYGS